MNFIAYCFDDRKKLRIHQPRLRLRVRDHVRNLLRLEQRVDWTSQRPDLPAREIRDHKLDAVGQQQANDVTLPDTIRHKQARSALDRSLKLFVGELALVDFREEKRLVWRRIYALSQQFRDALWFAGHGSQSDIL